MITLDLITIRPDSSFLDALAAIQRGGVRLCLVVGNDLAFEGILTDGDVRRALIDGRSLNESIHPSITREPIVVAESDSRVAVLEVMQARGLHAVPVVASGSVIGLHTLQEIIGTESRPNWAVVMAGGRGRRLGDLTQSTPKPMLKVAGRPILERILLHLVGSGIRKIALSVNYRSDAIEDHFGDGSRFGCQIEYLRESVDNPLGTAGSLALLSEPRFDLEDPFVVLNGDIMSHFSLRGLLDSHAASSHRLTVGATGHQYTVPFGVLHKTPEGELLRIEEKPTLTWSVGAGAYVLDPDVIDLIPIGRPMDMPTICSAIIDGQGTVGSYDLESDWIDVGNPRDLARARGEEV